MGEKVSLGAVHWTLVGIVSQKGHIQFNVTLNELCGQTVRCQFLRWVSQSDNDES